MKFRDLPILERKSGMTLWPPLWSSAYRLKKDWPHGEIGMLEDVWMHELLDRCVFLYVRQHEFQYTGSMYFDDHDSCMMIYNLLKTAVGRSLVEIGDWDISHLL